MDLLVAWEWAFDEPFVRRLLAEASAAGLDACDVRGEAIATCADRVRSSLHAPRVLVDRASDVDPEAARLARLSSILGSRVLNDPDRIEDADDKATMHLKLMSAGVHVPWTILLPPLAEGTPRDLDALSNVGCPFVIKPAHGGGGDGVVLCASADSDVHQARSEREDKFLVQELVVPADLAGRPAYFRVLHCLGDVHPCFWDPTTRLYAAVSADDRGAAWCRELERVAAVTASVSGMDLFSMEVAIDAAGVAISVDYLNDMCDLRPASGAADGVPDAVVDAIARRVVAIARQP